MSTEPSRPDPVPSTLRVTDVTGAVTEVSLTKPRVVVGRAQDADVRLDSGMVSRHHAELTRDESGAWTVRDLRSRNGTLVNGVAVPSKALRRGDRIALGPFTLSLDVPAEPQGSGGSRLPVSDAEVGRISTLGEVEPPRLSAAHLDRLIDFGRGLLAVPGPADRLAALCRLMVGRDFRALSAYALRLSGPDPDGLPATLCDPQVAEEWAGPAAAGLPGRISRAVLHAVRHGGQAVLAGNTGRAGQVEISIPSSVMLVSAVAVPLRPARPGAAALDVLYVTLPPDFGTVEWLSLTALAVRQYQQAEDAWAALQKAEKYAALEVELRHARDIQMGLVPHEPRVAGLDLAVGFLPSRTVGGDYVDVVPMNDGRTLLAVADVSGKGLPAALIASSLHTIVHTGLRLGMDLLALMAALNRYLGETLKPETYVTMVAVAIDPATGEFECVNAGHPAALLLTPGGGHQELASSNFVLSYKPEDPVGRRGRMEPGQVLCLYTDGLTELFGPAGRMLGTEGLCLRLKSIYAAGNPSAQDAADTLARGLDELKGRHVPDDRTFLLARRG